MKTSPFNIILALLIVLCSAQDNTRALNNRYIITAQSDTLPLELTARMDSLEAEFILTLDEVGVAVVTSTHPEFATEVTKIEGIGSVTDDFEVQLIDSIISEEETIPYIDPPFSQDSDPYFNLQWGLNGIHAVEAWNIGSRGDGVLVAVLDSGFDLNHPDLRPNIDLNKSISFVPNQTLQANGTGFSHGTHVSGIIAAADNGIGIIGVAPEARLMLVKTARYNGRGRFSWTVEGIKHAVTEGADIINMSFGAYVPLNESTVEVTRRVTTYAYNKGVTLIAAGGNGGRNLTVNKTHIYLPGGSPYVLAITATAPIGWAQYPQKTSLDNIARYSNYGDMIDFAAPGGDTRFAGTGNATIGNVTKAISVFDRVVSATTGGWAWASGTSMAVPHATGVVALIISNNGGSMSPDEVKRVLDASSDGLGKPGRDDFYGCGRLNAYRAVKCVQEDNVGLMSVGKF